MRKEDAYGELAEVVVGRKAGRITEEEIIVFDSTGVAIEDAIATALVYEKACASNRDTYFAFAV